MGRLRSLGYGVAVAGLVFTYLALPMLRELYGPEVMLIVYGVLALIAGGLAYEASRLLGGWAGTGTGSERPGHRPETAVDRSPESGEDSPDPEIDQELETIRDGEN